MMDIIPVLLIIAVVVIICAMIAHFLIKFIVAKKVPNKILLNIIFAVLVLLIFHFLMNRPLMLNGRPYGASPSGHMHNGK